MAASMVCRYALFTRSRLASLNVVLSGKRFILSSAYINATVWEKWEKETHNLAELAVLMDRTYDKKLPVSSLTIARFVDNITCKEELQQAEYYLYKFRHSPNCWYLRVWTIHGWIRKCIKYGDTDKALYTLKNKVQYGIIPDDFTFNLLLDAFIKKENFEDAVSVVFEIMLQESFDTVSTRLLSLFVLHTYLSGNPQLTWEKERNLGAALLLAGLRQEDTVGYSSQLYGHSLIGKVELSKGLRTVYTQMPLMWKPGYFRRALEVMEKVSGLPEDIKICKDAIEILKSALNSAISDELEKTSEKEDVMEDMPIQPEVSEKREADLLPEYLARLQELNTKLESLGKVEPASLLSLTVQLVQDKLPECEKADIEQYEACIKEWQLEQSVMIVRENELREQARKELEAKRAARANE